MPNNSWKWKTFALSLLFLVVGASILVYLLHPTAGEKMFGIYLQARLYMALLLQILTLYVTPYRIQTGCLNKCF